MMSFLEKLIDKASELVLAVSLIVYLSGYIIVNAYLSGSYIRQTQILHTSYISAGTLFVFINIIAAVFALPISKFFTWLYYTGGDLINKNSSDTTKRVFLWIAILLSGLILMVLVLWLMGVLSGYTTSFFLGLSSRNNTTELSSKIGDPLLQIYWRIIFVYLLIAVAINFREPLSEARTTLTILASLTIMIFGFIQYYSLLTFAGRVYAELPGTIGGGQPQRVRLFMEKEKAEKYKDLYTSYGFAFFPDLNKPEKITASNEMELIWQVVPNKPSDEVFTGYAVHPLSCNNCPVIVISASDIVSIGYFP